MEKEWSPFKRTYILSDGVTEVDIRTDRSLRTLIGTDEVYSNTIYQVYVYRSIQADNWPVLIWLSIKRRDKEPIHDWRDLQRIKNEIIGTEHEAVELYPAESRLVDTANQYHLWVLAEKELKFPFGWETRDVSDSPFSNSKQRPFNP